MNPDGMVALLNYREDGVTRMYLPHLFSITSTDPRFDSISHLLEGRLHHRQALKRSSVPSSTFVFEALCFPEVPSRCQRYSLANCNIIPILTLCIITL